MNEEAVQYPSLKNKVVLISGGSTGIGYTIVKKFLEQGSKVAFLDIDEDGANKLVKELSNYKYKPFFEKCDLKNIDQLKESILKIRNTLGKISILINSAANDQRHSIDEVTPEFWDDRMNINLRHFFFSSQAVYKDMAEMGKGAIVNIGSYSWMKGIGGMPAYTTAKSAIMGLTRSLAKDFGEHNIRVNCVVPGWIATERQKKLWLTPEIIKDNLSRQSIKRMLEPEDIAKVVLFFASDQSSGCSAQSYVVDGGDVN